MMTVPQDANSVSAPSGEPANGSLSPHPRADVGRRRLTFVLLGLVVLIGIGLTITWFAGLRNRFLPVNFGVVEPGKIYRSGQISQQVVRGTLKKNHIGVIINLTSDDTPDGKAEHTAAGELGVSEVHLGLGGDGLGDPSVYPKALAEMVRANREGRAVLVHCQSGAQRTGGIIATYRILVEGKSPDEAFAEMKAYGHDPRHNPLLIPFIREHLPQWKAQFEQYSSPAASQATTSLHK
jgi:protein tyrosine phosphatase (PTP) superfamily phosphohydrolase (DUF442 family)